MGVLWGCGGSSSGGGSTKSLNVSPGLASIEVGKTVQFTAIPTGGIQPVTWSVIGGGTVTNSGLYTAPATAGTYQVQVALASNPSVTAFSTVQVVNAVAVNIASLGSKVVLARSKVTLSASVVGASNNGVTWSLPGGVSTGSVGNDGVYVAPNAPGTYTVRARSIANTTKFADINVTVTASAKVRLAIAGRGDVDILMRADKAPNTCANMVSLANSGFYDGVKFHRREDLDSSNAINDFIIQGGDPNSKQLPEDDDGQGGPGYTIPFETNDLTHVRYAVAMARSQPRDSGGSQFYICQDPVHFLDGNYVVFGEIVGGFAVVDAMLKGDTITSATTIP